MSATEDKPSADTVEQGDELEYHCPMCDVHYPNEILTRVHIHRSEDSDHVNWNGFMPETTIKVVDKNGEVVGTGAKHPQELNVRSLTLDDIPDEHSRQHKCIILAGAFFYEEENYTELETAAQQILQSHGEDVPSYSTIRRVLREFYRPQEVTAEKEKNKNNTTDEQLGDLTPKQQGILIAKLVNPDDNDTQLAERAGGVSAPYPKKVYAERAPHVLDRLQSEMEDGASIHDIIDAEMNSEDIKKLVQKDFDLGVNIQDASNNTSDMADTDEQPQTDTYDMSVSEQNNVLSASPHDIETEDTTQSEEETDTTWVGEDTPKDDTETQENEDTKQTDEPTETTSPTDETEQLNIASPDEPISELDKLHERVSWYVKIKENEAQHGGDPTDLAFAKTIQDELEQVQSTMRSENQQKEAQTAD